jgi:hypothetical protein
LEVSASVDAAKTLTVDLKELEKQVQEVTPATIHAKLLDDFQYFLCLEIERWADDVNYVKLHREFKVVTVANIVWFCLIMEHIKEDVTCLFQIVFRRLHLSKSSGAR